MYTHTDIYMYMCKYMYVSMNLYMYEDVHVYIRIYNKLNG